MKTILLLGAGRSSSSLISYLLERAAFDEYILRIADKSEKNALEKTAGHPYGKAVELDVENDSKRGKEIEKADLVISLLPAHLHILAARDCIEYGKDLVTASYISPEIRELESEAIQKGVLIMNECGLDPGIDHMSAMEILSRLKSKGAELHSFRSYTGGLTAPESNTNPWGYKFTWNPRNVILAGQGTAKYIRNGKYCYVPYNRLFKDLTEIYIDGYGKFEGYPNRDSLAYRKHYDIENIPTIIRGTLRQQHFCNGWQVFITLGLTEDFYRIENSSDMTYHDLVESLIPSYIKGNNLEDRVSALCGIEPDGIEINMIRSTGIFENKKIQCENATPAEILQNLLEKKWKLEPGDKDMIVMQHQFGYSLNGAAGKIISSLVVKGDDEVCTGMAKTVGLPVGIVARMILHGKIKLTGVHLPVMEEVFVPVLDELKTLGIYFREEEILCEEPYL